MTRHFFTLFDRNYAARGLVMLESLWRSAQPDIKTTLLALDEDTWHAAQGYADEILRVGDLNDSDFVAVQATRSHEEFCWTCAPVLSDFMVRRAIAGDVVVYLDADLYFFSDPEILIAEMGSDKNILIHPHRFSADREAWETAAGTFNVGFVGFRCSDEAKACTARWRRQVLDLCVKAPEKGLCGDQGYLNEWPSLYPGLQIMQNIGGGTAPWNVNAYRVAGTSSQPTLNDIPIVFFHFHQLRIVDCARFRFLGVCHAIGYFFSPEVRKFIYHGYVKALKNRTLLLESAGMVLKPELTYGPTTFHRRIHTKQIYPVLDSVLAKLRFLLTFVEYIGERVIAKIAASRVEPGGDT